MPMDPLPTPLLRRSVSTWCFLALAIAAVGQPSASWAKPAAKGSSPADDLVKEATRRYKEGEFELAAQLFMKAYALDKRPDRVFNAARGYEKAGKHEQAIALFRLYAQITDDAAGRQEAELRVAGLEAAQKPSPSPPSAQQQAQQAGTTPSSAPATLPSPATKTAEPSGISLPPPVTLHSPPPAHLQASSRPAWAAFGAAALAAVSAGGLYYWVLQDETDLQETLEIRNDAGYVTGVDQEHAVERQAVQGTVRTWAAVGGGLALASVAVGLWLWPKSATTQVSDAPIVQVAPGSFAVMVRF